MARRGGVSSYKEDEALHDQQGGQRRVTCTLAPRVPAFDIHSNLRLPLA